MNILELPGTGCVCLGGEWARKRDSALERPGLNWVWEWRAGMMRSRVGADPAKKIPGPSGSFADSWPRIIM